MKNQLKFKSNLNEIKIGSNKSEDQKNITGNIFFNLGKKVVNLFRDYSFLPSEAKYKAKYGGALKILTPKQILQRLPIALAQVKTHNNSENLLKEIKQIVYSLYQSIKITEKVYNNNCLNTNMKLIPYL